MSAPRASPPPAPADTEAPPTAPPQTKRSTTPPPADAHDAAAPTTLAAALLGRLKPFLAEPHLEVEARLCRLGHPVKRERNGVNGEERRPDAAAATVPPTDSTAAVSEPGIEPHLVEGGRYRVTAGVSAADFARMKAYTAAEKAAMLPFKEVLTEDINTQTGRFTYAIAPDGTESMMGCIEKKRLCNVEVRVPGCPYDIRVSVSTEVPKAVTEAPAEKPHGFVRRKQRWTATEATYEYAFTRVGADNDDRRATYEVELEGVHTESGSSVTEAWLADLLDRLLTLAQLPGNTGLPQPPAFSGHQRHRPQ